VGVAACIWLAFLLLPRLYDWSKRRNLRNIHQLEVVSFENQERSPSQIRQDSWFGFDVINSRFGLTEQDPDPDKWARVKRTRGGSQYIEYAFPLEIHRYHNTTHVVGYVTGTDKAFVAGDLRDSEVQIVRLWMRPVRRVGARYLVEIPLADISGEGSRGLGTWKSPSFLDLEVGKSSN
jgi:hypothetical protein